MLMRLCNDASEPMTCIPDATTDLNQHSLSQNTPLEMHEAQSNMISFPYKTEEQKNSNKILDHTPLIKTLKQDVVPRFLIHEINSLPLLILALKHDHEVILAAHLLQEASFWEILSPQQALLEVIDETFMSLAIKLQKWFKKMGQLCSVDVRCNSLGQTIKKIFECTPWIQPIRILFPQAYLMNIDIHDS
jgi:hypothetical protein